MAAPKTTNIGWIAVGLLLIAGTAYAGNWGGRDIADTVPGAPTASCADAGAPRIVALELAGTPERARELIGDKGSCRRLILEESLRRDSVFILAYTATIGLFCTWGARRFRSTKLRALGWTSIGITVVAAGLDVAENALLQNVLDGDLNAIRYATAVSLAKWTLLVVPVVYALGALFTLIVRWFANGLPTDHASTAEPEDSWDVTAHGPERLRAIRGKTTVGINDRQWWMSRPPTPGAWDPPDPSKPAVGIAFSGGGIRSASFHLGVLEQCIALDYPGSSTEHRPKVLEAARYLATVSGGGYVGTARQITMHQANAPTPSDPPAATDAFAAASKEQPFVLDRRKYLWDTLWLRCLGLAKVFLGIAITLALFGLLIYLAVRPIGWFAHDYLYDGGSGLWNEGVLWSVAGGLAAVALVGYLIRGLESIVGQVARAIATISGVASGLLILVWLATISGGAAAGVLAGAVVVVALPQACKLFRHGVGTALKGYAFTIVGAGLAAVAAFVARSLLIGAADNGFNGDATLGTGYLRVAAFFVALYLVSIPIVYFLVESCPARWFPGIASVIVGAALVGFVWWIVGWLTGRVSAPESALWDGCIAILGLTLLVVDQRLWSPHVFYKKRLLHTFSPIRVSGCPDAQLDMDTITHLDEWAAPIAGQPELLVCAAVHLPGTTFGHRPAGSFTFSHALVGGPDVGWVPTCEFRGTLRGNVAKDGTLGAAMAISGAAIAAANGYMNLGGANAALALLNARLGVWLPNPTHVHELRGRLRPPEGGRGMWVGHRNIGYSLKEVFGTYDPLDRFVYVSDGGHHDNLGLIELLRRRCGVILCFDASGDTKGTVNTFRQVRRRAHDELGVRITVPGTDATKADDDLPAPSGRVVAYRIEYPKLLPPSGIAGETLPASAGVLVFGKCRLPSEQGDVLPCSTEQAGKFPHDSTLNQWFSEKRLDAYRKLGILVATEAIDCLDQVINAAPFNA